MCAGPFTDTSLRVGPGNRDLTDLNFEGDGWLETIGKLVLI